MSVFLSPLRCYHISDRDENARSPSRFSLSDSILVLTSKLYTSIDTFRWVPIKRNDWYWIRHHIKVGMHVIVEILVSNIWHSPVPVTSAWLLPYISLRSPNSSYCTLYCHNFHQWWNTGKLILTPIEYVLQSINVVWLQAKRDPYRFRFPIEMRFVDPNIDHLMYVNALVFRSLFLNDLLCDGFDCS